MHVSISNIGWDSHFDETVYAFMQESRVSGLELAPTRIFPNKPYRMLQEAIHFAESINRKYGLTISSMQSIWYGIRENIFESIDHRNILMRYTKEAIIFAASIGCTNLVFGCPRNRSIPDNTIMSSFQVACDFFNAIGDYAFAQGVYIAIEPNPPIYNTNFLNTTEEAFEFCKTLANPGVKVNVDIGTMIYYKENSSILVENIEYINHVHISEPHLVPIKKRPLHKEIITSLKDNAYDRFISIEMAKYDNNVEAIKDSTIYIRGICDDIYRH